jgi:hypothetical protein
MASAFRSSSNTTYAVRVNTTITAPASIADGDVLLLTMFIGRATGSGPPATPTPPTGFALLAGTWPIAVDDGTGFMAHVRVYYKIASGESGDYTVTHTTSTTQGLMFAVSGGSSSSPACTQNSGTGTTTTALGLTTTGADALIAFLGWDWGDTAANLVAPAGTTPAFTERVDVAPLTYLATGVLAAAGATGDKTQTNNSNGGNPFVGILIAVETESVPPVTDAPETCRIVSSGLRW